MLKPILLLALAFVLTPSARAQYDDCATAGLSSFRVYGVIQPTTSIDGASSCQVVPRPDLWWMYRPLTTGVLRLAVCGNSIMPVDVLASIHGGCPGTTVNEIACNDDAVSSQCFLPGASELLAPVTAGHLYYVRVSTTNGAVGAVTLSQISGPDPTPPPNADRGAACAIAPGLIHGNNLNLPYYYAPIWFEYTPATSGLAVASTCGIGTGDTGIVLWQDATYLGFFDDTCAGETSVTWPVTAGLSYQIGHLYASSLGTMVGPFTLQLTGPPTVETDCATAESISTGSRWLSFENAAAQGSSTCDLGGLPALEYRFMASSAGILTVDTFGSDDGEFPDVGEDTLVSLHSGCPATSSNTIACNDTAASSGGLDEGVLSDASVRTFVNAGQTVVIRVARVGAGVPDSNVPARLNVAFAALDVDVCAGDGTGTACPCGNSGAAGSGCANWQNVAGARLTAVGAASVSADSLQLHGTGMPPTASALYVQGSSSAAGGAGVPFGDGLRCVAGTVVRLGVRASVMGASSLGFADGSHVSQLGQVPPSGGTRVYQVWYRDAAPFRTGALFNLSNGVAIPWTH